MGKLSVKRTSKKRGKEGNEIMIVEHTICVCVCVCVYVCVCESACIFMSVVQAETWGRKDFQMSRTLASMHDVCVYVYVIAFVWDDVWRCPPTSNPIHAHTHTHVHA